MSAAQSVALFVLAALAEIGGAWLVWQSVRESRGPLFMVAGASLVLYGFIATFQPDAHFGRILAAYGGIFVAGRCSGAYSSMASDPTVTTSRAPRSASSASP